MKDLTKYRKASGMLLLNKYLPKVTPIMHMDIVESLEEWEAVKDKYRGSSVHRTDVPFGKPVPKNEVSSTNGFASEMPELLDRVKEQSPDGVVLLMATKEPVCPRYLYDGGFSVMFALGEDIAIELVGRAFDGHEVTQGLAVHEQYILPWDEVLFIKSRADLTRNRRVVAYLVSDEQYAKQRAERVDFLTKSCKYDAKLVEANVPKRVAPLSERLIRRLLDDIVLELMKQQTVLARNGLKRFGVQGNFVNGKVQPWEIFRMERWL